jgi:hypothetical protein
MQTNKLLEIMNQLNISPIFVPQYIKNWVGFHANFYLRYIYRRFVTTISMSKVYLYWRRLISQPIRGFECE